MPTFSAFLTGLTEDTSPSTGDVVPVYDTSGTSMKKVNIDKFGLASDVPNISSGSGAPGTTPGKIGDVYVDTAGPTMYVASGVASSADWTLVGSDLAWTAATSTVTNTGGDNAVLTVADSTNPGLLTSSDFDKLALLTPTAIPTISSGAGVPGSTPTKVGDIYIDTSTEDAYIAVNTVDATGWEKSNDGGGAGGTATDLSYVAADRELMSSTGANVILPIADGTNAGLLSSADWTALQAADAVNATTVAAAGALMDSEVDADIKTLVLPASTTISTFGASLVDDTTAAAARTTLGALGDVVDDTTPTLGGELDADSNGIVNLGPVEEQVNTVAASGASETLDVSLYGVHDVTMDQNCTLTFTNPAASGKASSFTLILRGAFTPTWPGTVDWPDATEPTYATPSVYVFMTVDGGTTWLGSSAGSAFG